MGGERISCYQRVLLLCHNCENLCDNNQYLEKRTLSHEFIKPRLASLLVILRFYVLLSIENSITFFKPKIWFANVDTTFYRIVKNWFLGFSGEKKRLEKSIASSALKVLPAFFILNFFRKAFALRLFVWEMKAGD